MREDNLPLEPVDKPPGRRTRERNRHLLPRLSIGPYLDHGKWYRIGKCGIGSFTQLKSGKVKYLPDDDGTWEFAAAEYTVVLYARYTPKKKGKARK